MRGGKTQGIARRRWLLVPYPAALGGGDIGKFVQLCDGEPGDGEQRSFVGVFTRAITKGEVYIYHAGYPLYGPVRQGFWVVTANGRAHPVAASQDWSGGRTPSLHLPQGTLGGGRAGMGFLGG